MRGEEECKLTKLHPHFFDRLTREEDALKQSLKPDWSKWKEEEESSQTTADETYEGVAAVKQLTAKDIDEKLKSGAVIVADVYFPWCTHCGYTRKAFVAAAKELSSEKHIFAWVDAREDQLASSRYKCRLRVVIFCA